MAGNFVTQMDPDFMDNLRKPAFLALTLSFLVCISSRPESLDPKQSPLGHAGSPGSRGHTPDAGGRVPTDTEHPRAQPGALAGLDATQGSFWDAAGTGRKLRF